jgi:hypothetical protein
MTQVQGRSTQPSRSPCLSPDHRHVTLTFSDLSRTIPWVVDAGYGSAVSFGDPGNIAIECPRQLYNANGASGCSCRDSALPRRRTRFLVGAD